MAYINGNKIPAILRKGDKGDNAFIRYSANADGTDYTEEWSEGQNYIGFATGQTAPTDKSGYTWVLLPKGEKGDGITPIVNVYNPDDEDIEEGGYYRDNEWVEDNTVCYSGYIPCKAGDVFVNNLTPYGWWVWIQYYDLNKNYLSTTDTNRTNNAIVVPNNENIAYFRFCGSASRRYSQAIYKVNTIHDIRPTCFVEYNKPFIVSNDFILADNTSLAMVKNTQDKLYSVILTNLFNPDDEDIEEGGYYNARTTPEWVTDSRYIESGYIPCKGGDVLVNSSAGAVWNVQFCFYDKEKNYITGANGNSQKTLTVPYNGGIAYMRIPVLAAKRYNYAVYNITDTPNLRPTIVGEYNKPLVLGEDYTTVDGVSLNDLAKKLNNNQNDGLQWLGKTWYAYGTSMTSTAQGKYVPVVQELSGMSVVNKGIPGGCLTPDGFGKGNVKTALMNTTDGKLNADLITIDVLPNEGATVGDIYDTDDTSFCGCLNQSLRYLQENTNAQIVLIIMIGGNTNAPDNVTSRGITQYAFSRIIKQVAELNSVPVIDVFSESGFGYGRVKGGAYQTDNIHLNDIGGKNMGEFVWSKLKNIPCWYTATE